MPDVRPNSTRNPETQLMPLRDSANRPITGSHVCSAYCVGSPRAHREFCPASVSGRTGSSSLGFNRAPELSFVDFSDQTRVAYSRFSKTVGVFLWIDHYRVV